MRPAGVQRPVTEASSRGWQSAAIGAAVVTMFVSLLALQIGSGSNQPPLSAYAWLIGPAVLLGPYLWREDWSGPAPLAIVTSVVFIVAGLVVLPLVAERFTGRGLAVQVNTAGRLPARLLVVDEGIGSFVFYLRPDLRRTLVEGRIERVSRFSLGDVTGPAGTEVAIAADWVPGVAALYEFDTGATPAGSFLIRPLTGFRRRPTS